MNANKIEENEDAVNENQELVKVTNELNCILNKEQNTIGQVLNDLKKDGIKGLDDRAGYISEFKKKQNINGKYTFDIYTEKGSYTTANIVTPFSGNKKECILWCINHYLNLNRNPNVIEKAVNALREYGTGCGTSAASVGMSSLHKKIEQKISQITGKEETVLYPTGYTANLAGLSCLTQKGDLILFDRECHASIIDGMRLSQAEWVCFKHNDLHDLIKKLTKAGDDYNNILVVVESAYSMSGDLSPLKEIVALKEQFGFYLFVDEAHSFGIYGDKGQGYCYEQGVTEKVDFIAATLSKATASIGGFIATKEKFADMLRWSNAYLFQACLTPVDAAVVLASIEEIENNPQLIEELHQKKVYMRDLLKKKGFNVGNSQSPIIPVYITDNLIINSFTADLYAEGIFSTPICYPAVKINEGRLRLILNISHTKEQIDKTVETIEKLGKKYKLIE